MIMVTQPPFLVGGRAPGESTSFIGVVAALFSALTAAGVNITITKLKGEPATTITLYAMCVFGSLSCWAGVGVNVMLNPP